MKAWMIDRKVDLTKEKQAIRLTDIKDPKPNADEILVQVTVCGVCHTELDEIEGRTPPLSYPMIPGHEVVGRILEVNAENAKFRAGDRMGVGWIFDACGHCSYCVSGHENLCPDFRATGRDAHGGYAEMMVVPAASAYKIPETLTDEEAAPLLCAGAIGYRSLKLTGLKDGQTLGLTGFGASGHQVLRMARIPFPDLKIVVFARNPGEREFARQLGAVWAGDTRDTSPFLCDAIIDTTPVWTPVLEAMNQLKPGGRLVINAIRKESADQSVLQHLDYSRHLWMEKEIKSVANITRQDIREFLNLASEFDLKPAIEQYAFQEANQALLDLKQGTIRGAKVLQIAD